ncbi:MAG: YraN family protein [Candidatus Krumholzibacteria bacterium]|nr:YraN family protein [Candidatus Krumholzibacteria bacterium]
MAVDGSVTLGAVGERIAALYLQLAGCTILERNFRFEHVEIDLIARDGDCIAFVEVKTRRSASFGEAREAVRSGKMRNLRKAARWFLLAARPGTFAAEYRFDLIALDCDTRRGTMALEHIKGIA